MRTITDIFTSKDVTLNDYCIAKKICAIYELKLNNKGILDTLILDYPFSVRTTNALNNIFYNLTDTLGLRGRTLGDIKTLIDLHGKDKIFNSRGVGKKVWDEISYSIY